MNNYEQMKPYFGRLLEILIPNTEDRAEYNPAIFALETFGELKFWRSSGVFPSMEQFESAFVTYMEKQAATKYITDRSDAFRMANLEGSVFVEAIMEHLFESKSEKILSMQSKREEIKALYPKPVRP